MRYLWIALMVIGAIAFFEALTRLCVVLFMRWMDKRRTRP